MKKVKAFKTDHPLPEGAKYLSSFIVAGQVQHYFLVEEKVGGKKKLTKLQKLAKDQKPLPEGISKLVDDNFDELTGNGDK
jgi:hypothetical protein